MAEAKKCDRCGKFYEPYPTGDALGAYNSVRRARTNLFGAIVYEKDQIDLCEQCMCELNEFLNNRKENK